MTPTVTVVGLGPAGADLVTSAALDALRSNGERRLRTARHPAAALATGAATFDHLYDREPTLEAVYESIVEELVRLAGEHGDVVYAVPGSPLVAETTVELLRRDDRVTVDILPALSFLDLAWLALGIDPLATGPRLVDGHRFAVEAAGERGPLLVAQCDAKWVLSDIKLAYEEGAPATVTVLQRLGLPDQSVTTIPWEDLDRVVEPDHLTTVWIEQAAAPVAFEMTRLEEVARRLRADCPWDREQTHQSLARYLVEEAYELVEAIEELDATGHDEHFIEELGDLLFQVLAHSAIAAEEGRFNLSDVAKGVADKLIARHPHVYGDVVAETADDVKAAWEVNKKIEKGRQSIMEGIPRHLPALLYASKVLKKAAGSGVTLAPENTAGAGLGGAFLVMVDEARKQRLDPETELRHAATRFASLFQVAEQLAAAEGVDLSLVDEATARRLWDAARHYKPPGPEKP